MSAGLFKGARTDCSRVGDVKADAQVSQHATSGPTEPSSVTHGSNCESRAQLLRQVKQWRSHCATRLGNKSPRAGMHRRVAPVVFRPRPPPRAASVRPPTSYYVPSTDSLDLVLCLPPSCLPRRSRAAYRHALAVPPRTPPALFPPPQRRSGYLRTRFPSQCSLTGGPTSRRRHCSKQSQSTA